ncbi:TetR/AcrR family transcriptional regulator [Streptomyces sp. NPDC005336]|uniref:TetR/AcrR family transcriptional regulator n=1 Tax=Streptomyces sp. NPDC005336 TaxID=3157035 RepID=UPI0033B777AA
MARTAGSTAGVTRQRILDAANVLFAEQGYAGTSMRDIARHLGMTSAALYYHFPAKEELLSALVGPVMDALDRFAEQADGAELDQEKLVRGIIAALDDSGRTLQAIAAEPTALRVLVDRHDLGRRLARLERLIAGTDDPTAMLRSRCALGAVRMGIMSTHARRRRSGVAADAASESGPTPPPPRLSDIERELLVSIALAVLNTPVPSGLEAL